MDTASPTRPEAADRVRLQQMLDELVAAGAMGALAQFRDGDSIWAGSSGVAELGSERSLVPDGWFRIGSVTKTFTAALSLHLPGGGPRGPGQRRRASVVPSGWFRIGGVTKAFPAALILRLAGEGRLGLDDGELQDQRCCER